MVDAMNIKEKEGTIFITLPTPNEYSYTRDNWANELTKNHPGPYRRLSIDLCNCKSVNSILCAGFIHLYRHYNCESASLNNANNNVKSILHTLQLDKIFQLEY